MLRHEAVFQQSARVWSFSYATRPTGYDGLPLAQILLVAIAGSPVGWLDVDSPAIANRQAPRRLTLGPVYQSLPLLRRDGSANQVGEGHRSTTQCL